MAFIMVSDKRQVKEVGGKEGRKDTFQLTVQGR